MKFVSHHIAGKGRGKGLGFPTINLAIPEGFDLEEGVYAARVVIQSHEFVAAMHYGGVPTFEDDARVLEVFLIDAHSYLVESLDTSNVQVHVYKRIRRVMTFDGPKALAEQISKDVAAVKEVFA